MHPNRLKHHPTPSPRRILPAHHRPDIPMGKPTYISLIHCRRAPFLHDLSRKLAFLCLCRIRHVVICCALLNIMITAMSYLHRPLPIRRVQALARESSADPLA